MTNHPPSHVLAGSRSSKHLRKILLLGVLVPLSACASLETAPFSDMTADAVSPEAIQVENHCLWDVRVYLDRDGVRFPLGRVNRMSAAVFPLTEGMLANASRYALVTEPVANGQPFRTDPVPLAPGRLHRWTLISTTGLFHGGTR